MRSAATGLVLSILAATASDAHDFPGLTGLEQLTESARMLRCAALVYVMVGKYGFHRIPIPEDVATLPVGGTGREIADSYQFYAMMGTGALIGRDGIDPDDALKAHRALFEYAVENYQWAIFNGEFPDKDAMPQAEITPDAEAIVSHDLTSCAISKMAIELGLTE